MKAEITVEMDNAAFGDASVDSGVELARILRDLADRIDGVDHVWFVEHAPLRVRDVNGNVVGSLKVTA